MAMHLTGWTMSESARITLRLDADLLSQIDAAPGANRAEKVRHLLTQRGAVAALLDDQRVMLGQVQKVVADLAQKPTAAPPRPIPAAIAPAGVWTPQELASLYQALALVSVAIGKPAMASEAANFCSSKVREISARK